MTGNKFRVTLDIENVRNQPKSDCLASVLKLQ